MFNIGALEILVLIVLAILMFGPEKVPEFAKKGARIYAYLRDVANNAQTQLRTELGPEYADLELADLNPKAFVKKHLSAELAMIEEAKAELKTAADEVKAGATELKTATAEAQAAVHAPAAKPTPFDSEAT